MAKKIEKTVTESSVGEQFVAAPGVVGRVTSERVEPRPSVPSDGPVVVGQAYEKIRWEFILEASEPIAHHSESFGNTSLAMRQKTRQPDGSFTTVPIVTGDTIRHQLREAASYALLDAAGMLDNPSLGESALRLLFNGGMISGSQDSAVKLDQYRELVELMPHLALLGGCAQNRSVPGRMSVSAAELICDETAHRMPEWVVTFLREQKAALAPARQHIEEVQRVRMDASLDPGKTKLLTDGGAAVRTRMLLSESGKETGDVVMAQDNKSSMMPRRFETLVAGSIFYWKVECDTFNALDRDTFMTMVGAFLQNARVGGKRATGHGRVRVLTGKQIQWRRPREVPEGLDSAALAPRLGSLFYTHVGERKERIRKCLNEVDA